MNGFLLTWLLTAWLYTFCPFCVGQVWLVHLSTCCSASPSYYTHFLITMGHCIYSEWVKLVSLCGWNHWKEEIVTRNLHKHCSTNSMCEN